MSAVATTTCRRSLPQQSSPAIVPSLLSIVMMYQWHCMIDIRRRHSMSCARCPLKGSLLANVNSRSRSLFAFTFAICCRPSVCLSVVFNVRAPYSGGSNFRQYFYDIRYLGHPLTSTENFTEIVPWEALRRGS